MVNNQIEHARIDLVFDLNGTTTFTDVAIVTPVSSTASLIAAASAWPASMAKKTENIKFECYPHINPVPVVLETMGRTGEAGNN